MIHGNAIGNTAPIKTLTIIDENNNEYVGVVTGSEVVFTANASSDIREGKVAATDAGIVTGSAFIPNYKVYTGTKVVTNGSDFILYMQDGYDYAKLQAIICSFNTSLQNSVSAEQIVVEDQVFAVKTTTALSSVTKDSENAAINLGISNTSGNMCLVRYFLYKELY